MSAGDFTLGAATASGLGLKIGGVNVYNAPSNRQEVFHVPGRIGDVVTEESPENWPNEIREYKAGLYLRTATNAQVARRMNQIRYTLMTGNGYSELRDTYEPEFYRRAFLVGDFVPVRKGAGNNFEFPLTFSCDPRRYIDGVDFAEILSAGTDGGRRSPQSPQGFWCYPNCFPILKFNAGTSTDVTIAFRHYASDPGDPPYGTISFAATNQTFTFDCETLECSLPNVLTNVEGDLYLMSMLTYVKRTGTSGQILLKPRWFVR
ncbi:MAG: hypothetical protein IKO68_11110 [Oscillospiraceae bacterium]|nr:hypothetical protein [Oscillospiraceae bacterium]MBR4657082.1 hypothetical protein [Oscillospiraceae bacterium]